MWILRVRKFYKAFLIIILVVGVLRPASVYGIQSDASHQESNQSEPDATDELLERLAQERREQIAEAWERGEFPRDDGGMIPLAVLRRGPGMMQGPLHGPHLHDPMRRRTFDEWCDRLGLTESIAPDVLEQLWRDYAERMNEVLLTRYPPVYRLSSQLGSGRRPIPPGSIPLFEELIALRGRAIRLANQTEDHLFRMLTTVDQGRFAEDVRSWHLYRRWERTSIVEIELSGASIHLSRLLDEIDVDWPNPHVRSAYEMEIAKSAERREEHGSRMAVRLAEEWSVGFYDGDDERYQLGSPASQMALEEFRNATRPLHREVWRRQRAMYNVNQRYLTVLSVLLGRADAERVYDIFMYRAFPDYFPNPYDLRGRYDKVLDDPTIGAALRHDTDELRKSYVVVQRGVDASLIQTIHDHEAEFIIERARNPAIRERNEREIGSELQRRFNNAVVFASSLVEVLGDHGRFDWVQEELEGLLEVPLFRR